MQVTRMSLPRPPKLKGRGPTLSTLHEVETILRDADAPLTLNEVKRRMEARAVRHSMVRLAVDELKRLGFVTEGSKGVVWSLVTDDKAWRRLTYKRIA